MHLAKFIWPLFLLVRLCFLTTKRLGDIVHRPSLNPKKGLRKTFDIIIYCWFHWTAWRDEAAALFVGSTDAGTHVLAILMLLPTDGTALHNTTQCLDANLYFYN